MTAVSVTNATTVILAPGNANKSVVLQNLGAAVAFIQWDGGPAVVANGFSLAVNASLVLFDEQCQRGINGITSSGTADIRLQVT